ncbi:DUF5082 domain-containing protein [Peribacillus cavernae]|uniref:DUF5082 domain-containing protein n=1 Tax=Peribacillus cavernae TaxID=1674310 RepID=A0A433HPA7_9BACI|nr:DUF5082 family protein [Peribacillus cavernae]MDQ0217383.1 uncharacterized protein YukE [Peribacillus cavernae]RUQ30168.1 DUF5082 domain-containing protein [Peribacillus cavernae]
MDYSEVLHGIHAAISNASSDLDAKIERLKRAKSEIDREQNISLGEIKKIEEPNLENSWTGSRARGFDEAREKAYSVMKNIANDDYDGYKQKIESKITMLEVERNVLNIAGGIAHEADKLLAKGEEAVETLEHTISDLKRRLF